MDQQYLEVAATHRRSQFSQPWSFKDHRSGEDIAVDRDHLPASLARIGSTRCFLGGEAGIVFLPGATDPAVNGDALRSISGSDHARLPPVHTVLFPPDALRRLGLP